MTVLMIFSIAACSSEEKASLEEPKKVDTKEEKSEKEVPVENKETQEDEVVVSASMEDILQEEHGDYSGASYNEAAVHQVLEESNFEEKDSFQVYQSLLKELGEGPNYQEYYNFAEGFNASIETEVSDAPEGMKLKDGTEVNGTANIAILLDASGSMAQKINSKTKMDLAKEAIHKFVASMPEGSNVSLRVYGHKGSNADSDKKLSCSSTEMIYDLKPYDEASFTSSWGPTTSPSS